MSERTEEARSFVRGTSEDGAYLDTSCHIRSLRFASVELVSDARVRRSTSLPTGARWQAVPFLLS